MILFFPLLNQIMNLNLPFFNKVHSDSIFFFISASSVQGGSEFTAPSISGSEAQSSTKYKQQLHIQKLPHCFSLNTIKLTKQNALQPNYKPKHAKYHKSLKSHYSLLLHLDYCQTSFNFRVFFYFFL